MLKDRRIACALLSLWLLNACEPDEKEPSIHIDTYAGEVHVPNELGSIPVITYHRVDEKDTEYTRSREGFWSDLQNFKKHGFHFISLEEFLTGKIRAPRGKIPLLLTFDDSSETQFKYLDDLTIAPGCAMHYMQKFQAQNPEMKLKAVYFVLPGASYPNNLFGQPEYFTKKLKYILDHGYEIESHTLWHANLRQYRDKIEEQLAMAQEYVRKYIPGHTYRALAVPYGIYPRPEDTPRLRAGSYQGKSYQNQLVFDFSNRLSLSIYDRNFDRNHVRRLHGNTAVFDKLFRQVQEDRSRFFISDGDPDTITVKSAEKAKLNRAQARKVRFI